jgi:hypothetical protein
VMKRDGVKVSKVAGSMAMKSSIKQWNGTEKQKLLLFFFFFFFYLFRFFRFF